jgi:hypothetical protein
VLSDVNKLCYSLADMPIMHCVCKRSVVHYCNIMQTMVNVGLSFSLFNVIETPNVYTIGRSICRACWRRGRLSLPCLLLVVSNSTEYYFYNEMMSSNERDEALSETPNMTRGNNLKTPPTLFWFLLLKIEGKIKLMQLSRL